MTIYMPIHQRQNAASGDPTWRYDCSAFCLAMYADAVTLGGLLTTARQVRLMSSEPVPDPESPGLNIPQLDVVAAKLRITLDDKQGHPWSEVISALQQGRRVLAQVDYKSLGNMRCQVGGDFGHMMLLHYLGSSSGSMMATDPLCAAPKVYPSDVVKRAMTRFALDTGVKEGVRFAVSRKVPEIA